MTKHSSRSKIKPDSRSIIAGLPRKKRQQLDKWLFEQNISYHQASDRCLKRLKVKVDFATIGRYYRSQAQKHTLTEIMSSVEHAKAVVEAFGNDPEKIRDAAIRIIGQVAFDLAMKREPGKKPDLKPLYAAMPLLMAAWKEEREDKKFALERERWEFDVVRTCHEHFNELQAIIANKNLDEPSRLEEIRRRLFGKNLPPEKR